MPAPIAAFLVRLYLALILPAWRAMAAAWFAALLTACAGLPPNTGRTESHALPLDARSPLAQLPAAARAAAPDAGTARADSAFFLLDSPALAFASRLALTQQAQRSLDIQYYAIHADASSRPLLRAIREAAARGVRVRILLDDFNSQGVDSQVLRLAFVPNIEMRLFNPLPGGRGLGSLRALSALSDFRRLQHRMHNKLYLADNALGIVGGRNLGDAYFGQATGSNFVDLDVLVRGALVRQMSASFDTYWNHPLAYPVEKLISRKDLDALRASVNRPDQGADDLNPGESALRTNAPAPPPPDLPPALDLRAVPWIWAPSSLLVDAPAKLEPEEGDTDPAPTVVQGLLDFMRPARRHVLIVSPYFVPGKDMLALFAQLRQRGVTIQVLTNSLASTDAVAAHIGYARHRQQLLRMGVQLYEMEASQRQTARTAFGSAGRGTRASLHAKLVVVDDRLLSIGSMNLDQRSQLQNSEVGLLIRSRALARQVEQRVEPVLQHSAWKVELDDRGALRWLPPADSGQPVRHADPDTSVVLRGLLRLGAPFAPDDLL